MKKISIILLTVFVIAAGIFFLEQINKHVRDIRR